MILSAVVISKKAVLDDRLTTSLNFADEVLVIFSDTKSSAKPTKKFRYIFNKFTNFADQRNFGLKMAKGDWVFFVDTDEIVSKQLAKEIIKTIPKSNLDGYLVRRQDLVYHQILLHGESGDIKILRLAKRLVGKFSRDVHEKWLISAAIGELVNPLYHQKDHFISEFLDRICLYGPFDAYALAKENKPFSLFRIIVNPMAKFVLNYFFKKGLLDGLPGLFQAYLMSVQSLSVRVFQWEKKV